MPESLLAIRTMGSPVLRPAGVPSLRRIQDRPHDFVQQRRLDGERQESDDRPLGAQRTRRRQRRWETHEQPGRADADGTQGQRDGSSERVVPRAGD